MTYSAEDGRRKRWPRLLLALFIVIVLLIGGAVFMVRREYNEQLRPVSASQKNQAITIPLGSSASEIAAMLEKAGLIRKAWAFEWYIRNHDLRDKLQAGTYTIRPNMSVDEIVGLMTQGKVAVDLLTILPAQRLDQIQKAFLDNGFSQEEVTKAFDPSLYDMEPALADKPGSANLEGYLYPDSFQKTDTTTAETIVRASLTEMQSRLTPDLRAGFVKQGLTVHEAVIMASIVEQEVSNPDDKPIVAQVFLKRYKIGMQLGSDVTAFYGAIMNNQDPTVFYDSPYNTRIYSGLPPGPISNVGATSLEAIANPADTDYLYFVAGDDGKTHFSNTLAEHEALTAQYCKKLCSL